MEEPFVGKGAFMSTELYSRLFTHCSLTSSNYNRLFQTNSNTSFVLEAQFVGVFLRAHIFIQGYFSTLLLQVQLITDHFKAIHAEDLF